MQGGIKMSIGLVDWSTAALKRRKKALTGDKGGKVGGAPTLTDAISGMSMGARRPGAATGGGTMPTGGGGGGKADGNKGWQPPEKKKKGGGGGGGGGGGSANTNIALPLYASGGSAKLPAHWGGEYLGISRNEGQPKDPVAGIKTMTNPLAGSMLPEGVTANLGGPTGTPPPEGQVVTGLNPDGTWQTNPMDFYQLFDNPEAGGEEVEGGAEEE